MVYVHATHGTIPAHVHTATTVIHAVVHAAVVHVGVVHL